MADLKYIAHSGEVASGTSAKTYLQVLAPTNQRLNVLGFRVSAKGTNSAQTPIKVEILKQTTAGTASGLTLVKVDSSVPETIQSTAQQTFTVEPTSTDVYFADFINANSGAIERSWHGNPIYKVPGGNRIGVRITADTNTIVSVSLELEE